MSLLSELSFFVLRRIGRIVLLHVKKSKSPMAEWVVPLLLETWQRLWLVVGVFCISW